METLESVPTEILFLICSFLTNGKEIFLLRSVSKTLMLKLSKLKDQCPSIFEYVILCIQTSYTYGETDEYNEYQVNENVTYKWSICDPVNQKRIHITHRGKENFIEAFNPDLNPKINPKSDKDSWSRKYEIWSWDGGQKWKIWIVVPYHSIGLYVKGKLYYLATEDYTQSSFTCVDIHTLSPSQYYLMWYTLYMIPKSNIGYNSEKTITSAPLNVCMKLEKGFES